MARVILADLADADIAEIIADIGGAAGASAAERYDAAFDEVYRRLESFPASGSKRPKLGKVVRTCLLLPYPILYEYEKADDSMTVLRILHGRRRITRRLLQRRS